MKDLRNHILYTIFLQYPFFRNISQFCELKDIMNLRKTNKLLYYHCISKRQIMVGTYLSSRKIKHINYTYY